MNKFHEDETKRQVNDGESPERRSEMILADWTYQKYKEALIAKEPYIKKWRTYIDAYNGDYFKNLSRPDYKSDEISNMIFGLVESMRPIMADEEVTFDVLPRNPEGEEKCDIVNKALAYEFDREGMRYKILQDLIPCLQLGTSIFFLPWDADAGTDGEVRCTVINPFNFFPDPLAQDIASCEFVIYATYKHVNQLKKAFPNKANLLEGGDIKYKELVANREQENFKTDTQVLVLEVWCRDYTYIDVEQKDGTIQRERKYPTGRVITTCPELGVVLSDKKNPYQDGKFPFVLHKDIDVPFEFWGKGEIEQLLSPQKYANELTNQIIDNAKHTANMQWVIDKNSGIGQGVLTNRPGLVIRKNPSTEVRRDSPPAMPSYVREQIEVLKADMETISGVHEVTQGIRPTGIQAGNAILALQEAGQSRIRLKIKIMEGALQELAKMWYDRMRQFWMNERYIRISKEDNKFDFQKVKREDLTDDYDIKIVSCATMAKNKSALLDLFIRLAQTPAEDGLPMIDRETILSYAPVTNRSEIIAKFKEISERQQQAQLEQSQMALQQIQEQLGAQMQQTQQVVQEVMNVVKELNQEVNKIANEHEALKEEEIKREIEDRGYQKGANDVKVKFLEQLAMQEDESEFAYDEESVYGGLTDADISVEPTGESVPEELLAQLDKLSPEELQEIIKYYPQLQEAIMGEAQASMQQMQQVPQNPMMAEMPQM